MKQDFGSAPLSFCRALPALEDKPHVFPGDGGGARRSHDRIRGISCFPLPQPLKRNMRNGSVLIPFCHKMKDMIRKVEK